MIRATIYVERQVWQGMKVAAHDHWLSLGAYLTEAHNNFNKVNNPDKVNKPQVAEKVTEAKFSEKAKLPSSTGAETKKGFVEESGSISEEAYEKIKPPENRKEVVNKIQTTLKSFSKNSQLGKKDK